MVGNEGSVFHNVEIKTLPLLSSSIWTRAAFSTCSIPLSSKIVTNYKINHWPKLP